MNIESTGSPLRPVAPRRMRDLPPSERPYERAEREGVARLTDAELIAIVLRTGDTQHSALELAYLLLSLPDQRPGLRRLVEMAPEELQRLPGIGRSKSLQLLAAVELGRRVATTAPEPATALSSPALVVASVGAALRDLATEQLQVLLIDAKNRLIRSMRISEGGLAAMVIEPRDVFREAVRANAAGMILVHNHPSGDPSPSPQDIEGTRKLLSASAILGIRLQDHLIIGREGYVSLREKTLLWEEHKVALEVAERKRQARR